MVTGSFLVAALNYDLSVQNRLAIAAIDGRMSVKTEDRYSAGDASRDFRLLRDLVKSDRDELTTAVKTRDDKFREVLKRLDAIERKMEQAK